MSSRMRYVFTPTEYEMLQAIVGRQLLDLPGVTMLALQSNLGEEGADRFLEKLQLLGLEAEQEQAEKEAAASGGEPMKQ